MIETVDNIELIKRWRKDWLFSLFTFSHLDFQRKLWIDSIFDIIGDFDEDMCQYFDNLLIQDNYQYQITNGYVTNEEYAVIIDFHKELGQYDDCHVLDLDILNDKSWQRIVKIGFNSWTKLKNIITDNEELVLMKELETKYLFTKLKK